MGKRRNSFVASDESGDERPAKQSKVSKNASKGSSSSGGSGSGVDADGNAYWELANNDKRRVTINKFGGKWLVNVREYYEDKAGDLKPGKKGISLSVEQYQSLVGIVPDINKELRKHGVAFEDDVPEEDDEGEKPAKSSKDLKKPKKSKAETKKANIEATSDESEGD